MNMKKCLVFCLKLMVSGVLALGILSLLCLFYYNPPLAVEQPDGYTNWRYSPNSSWRFMTEGNGGGTINSLGYNDPQDPVAGKPTICFLGSSQTEALQVDMEKNFVSLLEAMLASDGVDDNDYQCLNLGASGHFFNIVVSNFRNFTDSFEDVDYVVIEVDNIEFSAEELENMLNEEYHSDLGQRSFVYRAAQSVPYLRLLFKQYNDLQKNSVSAPDGAAQNRNFETYAAQLDPVMSKLAGLAREKGFELVILKHNPVTLDENNRAYAQCDAQVMEQFRQSCQANGIRFLCTDEIFCEYVNAHAQLPYGFSNTRPGTGHLNEAGHQLIAQLLYFGLFAEKEG